MKDINILGKKVDVIVDRPLGSYHPKYKNLYYPVNYGYVENIIASDNEWQDVYILGINAVSYTHLDVYKRQDMADGVKGLTHQIVALACVGSIPIVRPS